MIYFKTVTLPEGIGKMFIAIRTSYHDLKPIILAALIILSISSCQPKQQESGSRPPSAAQAERIVPVFNADSAFAFIQVQTDMGPRVPGTSAHRSCAAYLAETLGRFADTVYIQDFKARAYDGTTLDGRNIIAAISPEKKARICLAAHWDSRPFADHDPDPARRNDPVSGANDGASGVGILLEVARLLSVNKPLIGVDIIFFDLEDYGPPEDDQKEPKNENWGLGSQYWSKNTHVYNYRPRFVILLDMVGARGAEFRKEGFSMYFAPDKVGKVWDVARERGHQEYFLDEQGGYINDDHYFINTILGVPAIDIIHLDPQSSNGSFFEYWHTTEDTIDKIDKETLGVVGEVILEVVFRER